MDYWYKREHRNLVNLRDRWAERAEKSLDKNLEGPYRWAMNRLYETESEIMNFEKHFGGDVA